MIRRVQVVSLNYDHEQRSLNRAFKYVFGGQNVFEFDYLSLQKRGMTVPIINEEFVSKTLSFKPDWIWLQVQDTDVLQATSIEKIKERLPNTVVSHWTGDYRPEISAYLKSISRVTDFSFISSVGQIEAFEDAGAKNVHYLQIGLDWEEDVIGLPDWTPPFKVTDIIFIGNHYHGYFETGTKQRLDTIRALQKAKLPIGVVGNGWPADINVIGSCAVKQQHHVYKRAKVAINVNHVNDVDRYYSDRQLIAMASGTPLVCWEIPGLNLEFNRGPTKQCVMFSTPEECVKRVSELLANEQARREIGTAGRLEVMRKHDWINRIHDALHIITYS